MASNRWKKIRNALKNPKDWLKREIMVVFICARTLNKATYDGGDGLKFKVPTRWVGNALGFWKKYGPIIRLAATFLSLAVRATTGLSIGDLIPEDVANLVDNSENAVDFVDEYTASLGEVTDAVEGVVDISSADVQAVAGQAYREFGHFPREHCEFNPDRLDMVLQCVDK